ncbi:MAG: FAD-dependent oxidoreductase [bacterium]
MSAVTVIGAGLAGTVAAARLVHLGVPVRLIHDRPGVTPMHGGGWLLGLETLAGVPAARMDEVLAFLEGGLPELALTDGPFDLLDTDGVVREVDVAPASHAAGASLPPGSAAVDLLGLGHPFAEMCKGFKTLAIDWPTWPGAFGRSYAAAAQRLEDDATGLDALAEALRAALARQPAPGLLLPPVLGLTAVEARRARLQAAVGVPVAEALGTVPSTPGLRLWRALADWRARLAPGLTLVEGRVTALDLKSRSLLVGHDRHPFDALILATGGPIPGGLTSAGSVTEPLLGLRITPELACDWQRSVRPDRPYDADLFRAGVAVDAAFRPTRHDGRPVDRRLFAVGDLVAGVDAVADRCGSGLAILSGFIAAEAAAAAVQGKEAP